MTRLTMPHLLLAALLGLTGVSMVGCQAHRDVVAPVEPTWSYRGGEDQLSNNDTWEQMIPTSALVRLDETKLASVEEPTE